MLSLWEAVTHVHQEINKCKDVHCSIICDQKKEDV